MAGQVLLSVSGTCVLVIGTFLRGLPGYVFVYMLSDLEKNKRSLDMFYRSVSGCFVK